MASGSGTEQELNELDAGMPILGPTGKLYRVDAPLAAKFVSGDTLIANDLAGLLHIPRAVRDIVTESMACCVDAFQAMNQVTDAQIEAFFAAAANAIENDAVWHAVTQANARDVATAQARGRSTTRLTVSAAMRRGMIDGLLGWADVPTQRDRVLESVAHDAFDVALVGAALGPVGFVFEGRPNVLADACGVLRGGNTVIFRIGSDALETANAIMAEAIQPALRSCGLPPAAVTLIDSAAHAAGWAMFLDERLALAVARGSGDAVDLLGSLAQSVGTPVSLHGTGGAWMFLGESAMPMLAQQAVMASLDRKVCNTLNVCCVPSAVAKTLMPAVLAGIEEAGRARGQTYKLHVTPDAEAFVPAASFDRVVDIMRAEGSVSERQAERLAMNDLGCEWEWEQSPEVSLVVVDELTKGIDLFNRLSPRLVATLISSDRSEQDWFYSQIDAPFVGDDLTRWVDGQYALNKPELGLSNWANGRLFGRGGVLTGDSVYTVRTRYSRRK